MFPIRGKAAASCDKALVKFLILGMALRIRRVIDVGIDRQPVIASGLAKANLQHLHNAERPELINRLPSDRDTNCVAEHLADNGLTVAPPDRYTTLTGLTAR